MPRARTRHYLILHTMSRTLYRNTTRHILTTGTRYFEALAPLPLSNGRNEIAQRRGYCWIAANFRSPRPSSQRNPISPPWSLQRACLYIQDPSQSDGCWVLYKTWHDTASRFLASY